MTDLPSAGFSDPFGVDTDSSGRAVVADSVDVNGGDSSNGSGAVFRFTPGQPPAVFASSAMFRMPSAVAVAPGSPAVPTPDSGQPLPKKCKKGQKLKRGKCVKKKRKKKKR